MPPSSTPFGDDAVTDDQPYLSDEGSSEPRSFLDCAWVRTNSPSADVAVLHLIIVKAQELPHADHLPFRALFEAYDAVLAERGSDPDHDPIYFRFLLRLGALPGPGTLYEKFETLLSSMGISIEFDSEVVDAQEQLARVASADTDTGGSTGPSGSATKTPTRRASFSDFQDTIHDRTLRGFERRPRRVSFSAVQDAGNDATRRHSQQSASGRSASRRSSQAEPPRRDPSVRNEGRALPPRGPRSHPDRAGPYPGPGVTFRPRTHDISTSQHRAKGAPNSTREQHRPILKARSRTLDKALAWNCYPPDGRDERRHIDDLNGPHGRASVIVPPPPLSGMLSNAKDFKHRRLLQVCFQKWGVAAAHVKPLHRRLELKAVLFDRRILLRQALDVWRVLLRRKWQAAETERFFAHLERRAAKARDLFLLTKAFTHWAQVAHEGVQRTSVARRHLLRLKYFSAWQHITTVHELKVRRFRLRQSFNIWKKQVLQLLENELQAVNYYKASIARRYYWTWFWSFCERRAPEWYQAITKRKLFGQWIEIVRARTERCRQIEAQRDLRVARTSCHVWKDRLRFCRQEQEEFAYRWRRRVILRTAMNSWRAQRRLHPVASHVSRRDNRRLLRDTLRVWRERTEAERYAARVNVYRLKRNAWTAWNDRLRCQSLASQIDDRMVLQALYRWVLAERYVLCHRLFDHRLKRRALGLLADKWNGLRTELQYRKQSVQRLDNRRVMKFLLTRWRTQLQIQQQRNQTALEFAKPRLVKPILRLSAYRLKRNDQLVNDAANAAYFFLATKTIRAWKHAVSRSRKQKRLAAYAQVRRRNKMSLARGVLHTWRGRTAQLATCNDQATQIYAQHTQLVGIRCFDDWRARSWQLSELIFEGLSLEKSMLIQGVLAPWRNRAQRIRELDSKATYHAQLVSLKNVSALLRKLSLLAFQYRAHERNADDLRLRNDKQHARRIFRYWREKAAQRIGASPLDSFEQPSLSGATVLAGTNGESAGGLGDSGLGQDTLVARFEAHSRSMERRGRVYQLAASSTADRVSPIPAYMTTPSNRIARATALMRQSTATVSTTPRTPQVTPFESRLRSQLFIDRRTPNRRNDFQSSTFAPEES